MNYERGALTFLSKIICQYHVPILPLSANVVAVDFGAGLGYFLFLLFFSAHYLGVDTSSENLASLRKNNRAGAVNAEATEFSCTGTVGLDSVGKE